MRLGRLLRCRLVGIRRALDLRRTTSAAQRLSACSAWSARCRRHWESRPDRAAADRTRRERVLFVVLAARAVALAASAVVVAVSGPHWAVFLRGGITAGLGAAYRPAQLALVPLLARTPQELVATNVSGSILEGLAVLIGPALAGILLTFTGAAVVLAIGAAISAWAALLVARISSGPYVPARRERRDRGSERRPAHARA